MPVCAASRTGVPEIRWLTMQGAGGCAGAS